MAFGQRLRAVVKHYRYTQEEFAHIMGTSKANLFNYFADKTKPNVEMIARLKEVHNDLNISWLITGEGNLLESTVYIDHWKSDNSGLSEAPTGYHSYHELLKEKDKRIETLEELVEMLRKTIKRLEEDK